jgi:uncharacterized protein YggE
MRSAAGGALRSGGRQVLLGVVVVLAAVVAFALLTEALSDGSGGTVYLAQVQAPGAGPGTVGEPSLAVTGWGRASAPADSAALQFLVVFGEGFVDGVSAPDPEATPGAAEREAMNPIVSALIGAGVPAERIVVTSSPALGSLNFGPGGPTGVRVDVALDRPNLERLNALIGVAGQAARGEGLTLQEVGVAYAVADCAAVADRAWQLAVEDGRARAARQAVQLGVDLGEVLLASEIPDAAARTVRTDGGGCATVDTGRDNAFGSTAVGITVPPFDPTAPAEVEVVARVTVAFAIEPAEGNDEGS